MTIRSTSTVVIGYCINHWDYFARARPNRQLQEPLEACVIPDALLQTSCLREARSAVCAGIIPWNFPLVMAVWKLAPGTRDGPTRSSSSRRRTPR